MSQADVDEGRKEGLRSMLSELHVRYRGHVPRELLGTAS